jgi:hypothetical protein
MLIGAAVLLGGLYVVMSRKAAASSPPGAVLLPGGTSLLPGSSATTAGALSATNAIWANLTATTGPYSGYVDFPSGSQAAAGLLPWATDGSGNYYTQWAGHIFLVNVGQPDSQGNYPVIQAIS